MTNIIKFYIISVCTLIISCESNSKGNGNASINDTDSFLNAFSYKDNAHHINYYMEKCGMGGSLKIGSSTVFLSPNFQIIDISVTSKNKRIYYFDETTHKLIHFYSFKDGLYEGPSISYYENGMVKSILHYKNNRETGVWKYFDNNGNVTCVLNQN